MYCQSCGLEFPNYAKFCSRCGGGLSPYQIVPDSQQIDAQGDDAGIPSDQTNNVFLNDSGTAQESPPFDADAWWENCSKIKKTLIILGILLCCGIAIYLLVVILKKLIGPLIIMFIILGCLVGSEESKAGMRKFVVKFSAIIVIVAIAVVLLLAFPDFIPNLLQPGGAVRNAYLTQYSEDVTVEEAFDNFFDNGKWSTYKSDGYSYVAFTGTCLYLDVPVDVRIRFIITGEHFRVDSLDVNGESMGDLALGWLLEEVYESY